MNTASNSLLKFLKPGLSILLLISALVSNAQYIFSNLTLEKGIKNQAGAVYRSRSVYQNFDALIRIDSIINNASIIDIDDETVGFAHAFQPVIKPALNGNSYVVFTIMFAYRGTSQPTNVGTISISNFDLDGNKELREYCDFKINGAESKTILQLSELSISQSNGSFFAKNNTGNNYPGIDTSHLIKFQFNSYQTESLSFRLGAISENHITDTRDYSIEIINNNQTTGSSAPLTLLNFTAIARESKAVLNWSITNHRDFSHFVIERSEDGKNFKDIQTIFPEPIAYNTEKSYTANDQINSTQKKTLFYRLRLMYNDGKSDFSPIRMIRFESETRLTLHTFPNPVVNELRIMIPKSWQEKKSMVEIFNNKGILLNRIYINSSSQIQQLNVERMDAGVYFVKMTNEKETLSTTFIKY
jgi:hypothetical protein